jgi:hypothetical protein
MDAIHIVNDDVPSDIKTKILKRANHHCECHVLVKDGSFIAKRVNSGLKR